MSKAERDQFFLSVGKVLDEQTEFVGQLPADVQIQVKQNFETWQIKRAAKASQVLMQQDVEIEPVTVPMLDVELVPTQSAQPAYKAA